MSGESNFYELPLSRIKTIMKLSPKIDVVTKESLFTMTMATEYFIWTITKLSWKNGEDKKKLTYADLAKVAKKVERLSFLQEILPKKVTFKEYLELTAQDDEDSDEIL